MLKIDISNNKLKFKYDGGILMAKDYPFSIGKNFDKIIETQLKKPEIAMLELISNSWDANAHNVYIRWPIIENLRESAEFFTIIDDGEGMEKDEFIEKWSTIGYDKRENNTLAEMKSLDDRNILGKNGRGRLGLFSFSDNYKVSTSKNGKISSFKVRRTADRFATLKEITPITEPFDNGEKTYNSGTYINCPINDRYVELEELKEIISLRFGADSTFNIYINNEKVDLFNFKDNEDYEEIYYEDDENKPIKIYSIPKDQYNKKLSTYEVVWWVKNRYVEHDKWKNLGIKLDSKNHKENKYVFLICADFLETYVKTDWTGFKENPIISKVKNLVSDKINDMMSDIILTNKKERKISILTKSKKNIRHLNPVEQHEIGQFVEKLLEKCNHLHNEDLSNILEVVTTMELSNRKYEFFERLVNVTPDELDKLTEIIEKWSIDDAYLVLNELYKRLELIKKIDLLTDDPKTKEVQQLQPLFKEGLWIFHPKYEGTIRFTSNQPMNKVIVDLLGVEDYASENRKKRPDFVVLPNSTLGIFSSYSYEEDSNVIEGYDEILIIELKKGGSNIADKEMTQAVNYAKEIKKHGNVNSNTKIIGYVLGHTVSPDEQEPREQGNITVYAKQYQLIVKTAKDRTFDLIDKIKDVKGITDIGDGEIKEVLKEDDIQTTLSD